MRMTEPEFIDSLEAVAEALNAHFKEKHTALSASIGKSYGQKVIVIALGAPVIDNHTLVEFGSKAGITFVPYKNSGLTEPDKIFFLDLDKKNYLATLDKLKPLNFNILTSAEAAQEPTGTKNRNTYIERATPTMFGVKDDATFAPTKPKPPVEISPETVMQWLKIQTDNTFRHENGRYVTALPKGAAGQNHFEAMLSERLTHFSFSELKPLHGTMDGKDWSIPAAEIDILAKERMGSFTERVKKQPQFSQR